MAKFRSFPKKDERIDKGRVKELYLRGTDYSWANFCLKQKFNPALRSNFAFSSWQAEWIRKKTKEHQELLMPNALEAQNDLSGGRIEVVRAQIRSVQSLRRLQAKALADFEMECSQKGKVDGISLVSWIQAEKTLQQVEHKAVLLNVNHAENQNGLGSVHMNVSKDDLESDGDDSPEQRHDGTVPVMIEPGKVAYLPTKEVVSEMMKYFDQFNPNQIVDPFPDNIDQTSIHKSHNLYEDHSEESPSDFE